MSLVSVDQLSSYMNGITFDLNVVNAVQDIIDGIQQQLEEYINRPVEPVRIRERVQADPDGTIYFSITPVLKVLGVYDQGGYLLPINTSSFVSPLTSDDITDLNGVDVLRTVDTLAGAYDNVSPMGYDGLPSGLPGGWYVLDYVGCYVGMLSGHISKQILKVSAREVQRNFDNAVSIKGGIVRDTDNFGPLEGFTTDELIGFDRIRRRVIR